MGRFISTFLASVQYAVGVTVFRKPETTAGGPMLSCIIALTSVFLLLWSLPIYPKRLRKPIFVLNYLTEYVLATFYIETIMASFWFPLESATLSVLSLLATSIEETLWMYNLSCLDVFSFTKTGRAKTVYSLILSVTILLETLHATKIINLKLLSRGIRPFFIDHLRHYKRFSKNFPKNVGFLQDYKNTRTARKTAKYCSTSEPSSDFEESREGNWDDMNDYFNESKEEDWDY